MQVVRLVLESVQFRVGEQAVPVDVVDAEQSPHRPFEERPELPLLFRGSHRVGRRPRDGVIDGGGRTSHADVHKLYFRPTLLAQEERDRETDAKTTEQGRVPKTVPRRPRKR